MPEHCGGQVQACATRVSRLEPNGVPDPGANNLYVSDALVLVTFTPEIVAGEEIEQKNGCGAVCVNFKDDDRIKRWNVVLQLCTPDPFLHELLVGGTVLEDGEARGYAFPALNTVGNPNGISLEFWSKRVTSDGSLDPDKPYAWWVAPRVKLQPGERSFQNAALGNPFTGFAVENENWFDGPLNDWPVASDRALQWLPTEAPPVASCGYQSLQAS